MDTLLLHKKTKDLLDRAKKDPAQGYLFVGVAGSGRATAAKALASVWSRGDTGAVHLLEPEAGSIGIDHIHAIRPTVQRRVLRGQRRVIVIDDAHLLTIEAQNTLLKLLEEPPKATSFILLAQSTNQLLPTVVSRLQTVRFHKLDKSTLLGWYEHVSGSNRVDSERAYYLGGRTPGGMKSAEGNEKHLDIAKEFVSGDIYSRALAIKGLQSLKKHEIASILERMIQILEIILEKAAHADDLTKSQTIAARVCKLIDARRLILSNVNKRIVLSSLVVDL